MKQNWQVNVGDDQSISCPSRKLTLSTGCQYTWVCHSFVYNTVHTFTDCLSELRFLVYGIFTHGIIHTVTIVPESDITFTFSFIFADVFDYKLLRVSFKRFWQNHYILYIESCNIKTVAFNLDFFWAIEPQIGKSTQNIKLPVRLHQRSVNCSHLLYDTLYNDSYPYTLSSIK